MLRKLRYMFYSIILSMILLAGCGQQTRPVSTAQYYNPAKETAADTEEAEGAGGGDIDRNRSLSDHWQ